MATPWRLAFALGALTLGCRGHFSDGETPRERQTANACTDAQTGRRLLRPLTRDEYARTIEDLLGVIPDTERLPVPNRIAGYDNNADGQSFTTRHVDEYLAMGGEIAAQALATQRARVVTCDLAGVECRRSFVESFALRAYRRPSTEAEVSRLLALFDDSLTGGSSDRGAELVIQAALASPHFLFRSEIGEPVGDVFVLTPYEVASALSYLFLGTIPDDELLRAAQTGELAEPEAIEAQARRLLEDPRARDQVASFASQWLGTHAIRSANKDLAVYPTFTTQVREAFFEEERRFVTHVVFDSTGMFAELFTADYVFANAALREFYGLPSGGSDFELADAGLNRGGVLRLGTVLASHAHSNESSPIRRGLFVRSRLLCQTLSPPPPSADTTPPGLDPSLTTRARFARHTEDRTCQSCHRYIDDVGFGFEGYDGVGGYRTVEGDLPVDESGVLRGLESLMADDSYSFVGPGELAEVLAHSPTAMDCMALQYFRFARGVADDEDICPATDLAERFAASGGDIRELLIDVVTQRSFLERTGEPEVAP